MIDRSLQNKRFREEPDYLVKRLRESDEEALAFLLTTYGKSLYFYCNSILKNDVFSEDIVQESFMSLWERRKDFVALLPIRVFLYQSARNKCLDQLKHQQVIEKHENELIREVSEDTLDEKMIEEELLGQLYRAIEELPTECARAFKLGLEGLSNQEIADTLKVSIHTVKTQKQRAMTILKNRFGAGVVLVVFGEAFLWL